MSSALSKWVTPSPVPVSLSNFITRHRAVLLGIFLGCIVIAVLLWPTLRSLHASINLLRDGRTLATATQNYISAQAAFSDDRAVVTALESALSDAADSTTKLEARLSRDPLARQLLPPQRQQQLASVSALLQDAETVFSHYSSGDKRIVVLLQNTHELRPTGGFIGSYAMITLRNGSLIEHSIQDIYEVDGQISQYPPAPAPIATYLSEDDRLHLQDANWHPDFSKSGQQILDLMARGGRTDIDTVVALNLDLMERVLALTGPVYLADYDVTVSSKNIAQVARADRVQFFAGSNAKSNFLNALLTQLKLRIESLSFEQQRQLAQLLLDAVPRKDIQLYSRTSEMQSLWSRWDAAGQLSLSQETGLFIFPVEANVGVNKVNRAVRRSTDITRSSDDGTITLQILFQNDDPRTDYINYQRLLTDPDLQLVRARFGRPDDSGAPISDWDVETLEASDETLLTSYGHILVIPAQSWRILEVTFAPTDPALIDRPIHIEPQSGTIGS